MATPRWSVFNRLDKPAHDQGLTLNGLPLSEWGLMLLDSGLELQSPESRVTSKEMPGLHGVLDTTLLDETGRPYLGQRECVIHVATTGDEPEYMETRASIMRLMGETVTVGWRTWPGTGSGRLTVGDWSVQRDWHGRFAWAGVDLTVLMEPFLEGMAHEFVATVSDSTVYVDTDGPVRPTITSVPPNGTKRLYLTVGGRQLVYNFPGNGAGGNTPLVVDCENRQSTFGGTPIFPTIDSDYPVLLPGVNHVQTSAGEMTVTYRPHHLI